MAYQVKNASQDSRRNLLAVWNLDNGSLTQLGKGTTEQITPLKNHNLAYAAEWKEWALERSMGASRRRYLHCRYHHRSAHQD